MPLVQVIQPIQQQPKRLRVAAYARVSSKSADQLNSMSVQVEYYTDIIQKNPNWEFVGVYADEGVSGTSLKNRTGFNHLMDDCRLGLIDRILVKSSSRMARNSLDFLSAVRELKSLGVIVEFEKERFDTDSTEGELLLGMMCAVAQEESLSISKNLRWGIRKRMESGTYHTSSAPYGYKQVNYDLIPIPGQIEIVRGIFDAFLQGKSTTKIADDLNRLHPDADKHWHHTTIERILKNEKYAGFQKAQVLCQRKAPTYTEALKDIRGDIICPDCDSRLEWQTKGRRWRCRHCAAFSVQIAPDILLQSIATTMKRLQDNPDSINDQPLSHNTVSIEAEKQQAEIDEMLSAGEFDAASLIQSVLSRADTQYLCCTAGNSDPMTLRIKEALAAAPPCDTFDTKLYHTIADKIVLHRTTSIQLKLINGMVV